MRGRAEQILVVLESKDDSVSAVRRVRSLAWIVWFGCRHDAQHRLVPRPFCAYDCCGRTARDTRQRRAPEYVGNGLGGRRRWISIVILLFLCCDLGGAYSELAFSLSPDIMWFIATAKNQRRQGALQPSNFILPSVARFRTFSSDLTEDTVAGKTDCRMESSGHITHIAVILLGSKPPG